MADIDTIKLDFETLDLASLFTVETILRQVISKKSQEVEADILLRHEALLEEAYRVGISLTKRRGHKKYRNPQNPEEIWSGHGRQPRWLVAAIQEGKNLEDMEVKE